MNNFRLGLGLISCVSGLIGYNYLSFKDIIKYKISLLKLKDNKNITSYIFLIIGILGAILTLISLDKKLLPEDDLEGNKEEKYNA